MNKFIPDNIKFAKSLLQDVVDEGYDKVVEFHDPSLIQEKLKEFLDYVNELERLPDIVEGYLESRRELDNSLQSLAFLCSNNHK